MTLPATIWIPAQNLRSARVKAQAIRDGALPVLSYHLNEEAAEKRAEQLSWLHDEDFHVYALVNWGGVAEAPSLAKPSLFDLAKAAAVLACFAALTVNAGVWSLAS